MKVVPNEFKPIPTLSPRHDTTAATGRSPVLCGTSP